jgi:ATP-binding cassette subfamily B protein
MECRGVERVGEPLIGVEDMETPRWAEGYAATAHAGLRAVAAKAPGTVALAVRWAWRASPRLTLLAGVVQLAAGTATAFGLLATADVFTQLLAQGPTPERLVAALPAIAMVVGAAAARGLLEAGVAAVQGALVPRVEQRAQDELHVAVIGVDLAAFDDADFSELVERATMDGPPRVRRCVEDTGDLIAGLVSVSAAVVSAGVLHPVLAPVVLIAALPQGWASVRSARLMFASVVRMTSARRRISVTSLLITQRDPAPEVRAFTTQQTLLG